MAFSAQLDQLNNDLLTFNDTLQIQVEKFNIHNQKQIKLIQNAIQHLDRVLQMESRQRLNNFNTVKQSVFQLTDELEAQFEEQITEIQTNNQISFQTLDKKNQETQSDLDTQNQLLQQSLIDWKSANVKSTALIKQKLDKKRAERIQRVSDIKQCQETQLREFNQRLLFWQNTVEQSMINMVIYGQNIEKSYENGNKDDLQKYERFAMQIKQTLENEISVRKSGLLNLSKTLSIAVETLQNSMNQLSKFYE